MTKSEVRLGGVPLSGMDSVVWQFTTGTQPYMTVFQVPRNAWETQLRNRVAQPLTLEIMDTRGTRTTIAQVYILHEAPSDSPNRVNFVCADKRWLWSRPLIVRDFNIPRKTGNLTVTQPRVPLLTTVPEYDYLPYSLDNRVKWTPKRAIEEVMELLESEGGFRIDSFPIEGGGGRGEGEFSLQNVRLRDNGDLALTRIMAFVPGTEVYIDEQGVAVIFDGTDLDAVDQYIATLPSTSWGGEAIANVDRKGIRPGKVIVHYQREVEVVFAFEDDYSGTTASQQNNDEPYLDNVVQTVDTKTTVTEFDPVANRPVTKSNLPPGTWVKMDAWLDAMDLVKPSTVSVPWNFETIRKHWLTGKLDGVLGAGGKDTTADSNVSLRVQAIKQHFRQTFRINRRYMERVRQLIAVRAALLDPVTGARAPAGVWGQATIIPSDKGYMVSETMESSEFNGVWRLIDDLPTSGENIIDKAVSPARVSIVDQDLGIFRVDWVLSPYGTESRAVPGNTVDPSGSTKVVHRDLAEQDDEPMGEGLVVEDGTNYVELKDSMKLRVMLTIVPAAPNNKRQFHRVELTADDIRQLFRTEFRIQSGEGPDLEVFVQPGELAARFGWRTDSTANATIEQLLGLSSPNPATAGIEGTELEGFTLVNGGAQGELEAHARAVAAEMMVGFADSVQGVASTIVPSNGVRLVGNLESAAVSVDAHPSATVRATHEFVGRQKPIGRFALMDETTRGIVLGIVDRE